MGSSSSLPTRSESILSMKGYSFARVSSFGLTENFFARWELSSRSERWRSIYSSERSDYSTESSLSGGP